MAFDPNKEVLVAGVDFTPTFQAGAQAIEAVKAAMKEKAKAVGAALLGKSQQIEDLTVINKSLTGRVGELEETLRKKDDELALVQEELERTKVAAKAAQAQLALFVAALNGSVPDLEAMIDGALKS